MDIDAMRDFIETWAAMYKFLEVWNFSDTLDDAAERLGITIDEASELYDEYHEQFPALIFKALSTQENEAEWDSWEEEDGPVTKEQRKKLQKISNSMFNPGDRFIDCIQAWRHGTWISPTCQIP